MSLKEVARIGDQVEGFCSAGGHAANRPFIGTWQTGSPNVKADTISVVRIDDTGITDCGHTFKAVTASNFHKADSRFIHRVDDLVEVIGGGTGHTITGSPTVKTT